RIRLGLNIDHVATLRQARYRHDSDSPHAEPDPVPLALLAEKAGADGITVHLREDRRHIQDHDVKRLRKAVRTALNLEMAVTPAMVAYALKLKPEEACLVPENRQEITTEGGLDLLGSEKRIAAAVAKLVKAGIVPSLFIDPDPEQIAAAARIGAPCIELHTGAYANARTLSSVKRELERQWAAAEQAHALGLQVNAGHGLHYRNIVPFVATVPHLDTLNIGHSIVARAVETGLAAAVREMKALLSPKKAKAGR
ncbi:MAG TPA: pyridoxine 5'-phosphate synthase, partial [Candidatus Methylacidiphilales bacterium]